MYFAIYGFDMNYDYSGESYDSVFVYGQSKQYGTSQRIRNDIKRFL